MDNKFTIIKATDSENEAETKSIYKIILANKAWERQFFDFINKASAIGHDTVKEVTQDEIMRIGLSGVKYICSLCEIRRINKRLGIDEPETLEFKTDYQQLLDFIFSILGDMTLRNLVITFPIKKDFDGAKWECKDYFFTMDVLSKMEWDEPIGRDNVFDLLWDYMNDDLREICIEYMGVISEFYRLQTGKGIAEQFCEENNIGTYTVDRKAGIIKNNQTGDIAKLNKASHLKIIK